MNTNKDLKFFNPASESDYHVCIQDKAGRLIKIKGCSYWSLAAARKEIKDRHKVSKALKLVVLKEKRTYKVLTP